MEFHNSFQRNFQTVELALQKKYVKANVIVKKNYYF